MYLIRSMYRGHRARVQTPGSIRYTTKRAEVSCAGGRYAFKAHAQARESPTGYLAQDAEVQLGNIVRRSQKASHIRLGESLSTD